MTEEQLTELAAQLGPQVSQLIYEDDKFMILTATLVENLIADQDLDVDEDLEMDVAMKVLEQLSVNYGGR